MAGLPQALTPAQLRALLSACDRRTPTGRRDYAIVLLLARLGLRAGEVARLGLDDIDWRRGELRVVGKGNRGESLPLPADVGAAITAYLRRGRPTSAQGRSVFVRVHAPHRALTAGGIGNVVNAAGERAGLGHVHAHQLRHSAATAMLRAGSPLAEVGQVLRHRSQFNTAIYAKVDQDALAVLARPWPVAADRRRVVTGALRDALADYLALRRALGYRLDRPEKLLNQFLDHLDATHQEVVTVQNALEWAQLPANGASNWWGYRLSTVRGFATYLHALDPAHEVPAAELLPQRPQRATPYSVLRRRGRRADGRREFAEHAVAAGYGGHPDRAVGRHRDPGGRGDRARPHRHRPDHRAAAGSPRQVRQDPSSCGCTPPRWTR